MTQISVAYEVLKSDIYRKEYDELLQFGKLEAGMHSYFIHRLETGIPLHQKYYGKYAHKYGVPDHDIRWVLFWLVTLFTVLQYAYGWYRYKIFRIGVMKTSIFKQRLRAYLQDQGIEVSTKKKRGHEDTFLDDANLLDYELEDWTVIGFHNIPKPELKNLSIFRIPVLIMKLCLWLFLTLRYGLKRENPEVLWRRSVGMENSR